MKTPTIIGIAAIQEKDRGIGKGPNLLFRISDDLKRFKRLTTGHAIVMGRKTFESFGAKPLPNRLNIVITRNDEYNGNGATVVHSIDDAISEAIKQGFDTIFIIGGGEIYRQSINMMHSLELTIVYADVEADVFFPDYSMFSSVLLNELHHDEKSGIYYQYVTLSR